MGKKERKRRAEIRRNQKLARKAKRDADSTPVDAPQVTERVIPGGPESVAEIATRQAEDTGEGARATPGRRISDVRARAMLEDAAELLQDLINKTREALKSVAPARVAAAMDVIEESKSPQRGSGTPQQQPRRGSDPLVTMIKQGISASNLLKRIIATLYPKLAKIEVPALV